MSSKKASTASGKQITNTQNETKVLLDGQICLIVPPSVILTVQLIHPCTHQQHRQRQNQAAVHRHPLPRVGNVAQALERQDPLVRHCGWTQTQLGAKSPRSLCSKNRRDAFFSLRPSDSLSGYSCDSFTGEVSVFKLEKEGKGEGGLKMSGSVTVPAPHLPEVSVFVSAVDPALPRAAHRLCSVLRCS